MILSDLYMNLYATIDSIAKTINKKYYDNDPRIEKELTTMETTRALFAHEIKAKGKAEGEAIGKAKGEAKGEIKGETAAIQVINLSFAHFSTRNQA